MVAIANKIKKWRQYFSHDLWELDLSQLNRTKRFGLNTLKTVLAASHGFLNDKAAVRASALTFYSILSFVPVLAVAFGIAQGFGLEEKLEEQIRLTFAGQEEVMDQLIAFSHSSLNNTKGGLIAGISVVFLLWSVIKLLNHVEGAFNSVWNIDQPRPFLRKFTEYLTLVLVAPMFITMSGGVTIWIETTLNSFSNSELFAATQTGVWTSMKEFFFKLLPSGIMAIFFTLIFMVIPNKIVRFKPAFIAGIICGIAFTLLQIGYVYFQLSMSRYNAIYGSFAALPLFLIWLQTSWMLILFGGEISFAINYLDNYKPWDETAKLSLRKKRILALTVLKYIANRFEKGLPAETVSQISRGIKLPDRQVILAIKMLHQAGIILETDQKKKRAYIPAKSVDLLTLEKVIVELDKAGENGLSSQIKDLKVFETILEKHDELLNQDGSNKPITEVTI